MTVIRFCNQAISMALLSLSNDDRGMSICGSGVDVKHLRTVTDHEGVSTESARPIGTPRIAERRECLDRYKSW